MLIYLSLVLVLVNCGGDIHSNYYEGETYEIQGKVMGALKNTKVTLYLDEKSEPIATTNVKDDGSYILKFTPEVNENILKSNYALVSATDREKTYTSIVAFYDANSSNAYKYKDTTISKDTQAIYDIKTALKFDKSRTKKVVGDFLKNYEDGEYKATQKTAYEFPLRDILLSTTTNKLTQNEILEELTNLELKKESVDEAKTNKATKYAFTSAKAFDGLVVTHFISFDIANSDVNNTSITFDRELKGKSDYYDSAKLYKFTFDNSNVKLKKVIIESFESENGKIEQGYMEHNEFFNQKTSQIVKNKRLPKGGVKISKKSSKRFKNISYKQYKSTLEPYDAVYNIYGDSIQIDIYTHYKEDLWFYCGTQYDMIDTSSCLDYHEDKHVAVQYDYYYQGIFLNTEYDFIDNDNLYTPDAFTTYYSKSSGTYEKSNKVKSKKVVGASSDLVAFKTLSETVYQDWATQGVDSLHSENTYKNVFEEDMIETYKKTNTNIVTHTIRDFDYFLKKLQQVYPYTTTMRYWMDSQYYANIGKYMVDNQNDGRIPLLLIHGWQGDKGLTNPAVLLEYENNEFSYWHNFISYYLATPELHTKYKLYTYHYPSYKHITYNARKLKEMLETLKSSNNTVLGKALNSDGIVIMGHSMGGLVARSLIEEHKGLGTNAQKLKKLITLDTPHHGSHGAVQAHPINHFGDNTGIKNLHSAGSVDLIWDNYDKYYTCDVSFSFIDTQCGQYENTLADYPKTNIGTPNPKNRYSRYEFLGDNHAFDDYYFSKIVNRDDTHDKINPYLAYLNRSFEATMTNIAQNKYIFYVAHSSPQAIVEREKINPVTMDAMTAVVEFINGLGYGSGGAEAVCSAFLSKSEKADKVTRFNKEFEIPKKFIMIDNNGVDENYNIPYRKFWDYNHERIMNGLYVTKGNWDRYIDAPIVVEGSSERIDICNSKVAFNNFLTYAYTSNCANMKNEYYKYARDYLLYGSIGDELPAYVGYSIFGHNPLKTEPVFMVMQKDLNDISW